MILLKNAHILTLEKDEYENGYIIADKGKIAEIGDLSSLPEGQFDEVYDLDGSYLCPGFVDPHCHVGMWNEGIGDEGADGNEDMDPVTPQLRAIDGINPQDKAFADARLAGVTTVVTGPGSSNVIGGQFAALKTCGNYIDEMIIKAPAAIKVALGENPKLTYSEKDRSPVTRMGTAALLRETLAKAKKYYDDKENYNKNSEEYDEPEWDFKLEAMLPVICGEIPLKIHAHRADDIATAVRIAKEFGVKYTIEHATEAHIIPQLLRENQTKVIVGPLIGNRSKPELSKFTAEIVKVMWDREIPFAIMTDHPEIPVQYLPLMSAIAVKNGIDKAKALEAITINAATLCGIEDRVGSLKVGKDADFVVTDIYPIDFYAKVEKVFINGNLIF